MKDYKNVVVFDHPLIKHKIAILRDEKTSMKEFRELIEEITTLMTYEALKDGVEVTEKQVKTPLEVCTQQVIADNSIAIVPILRAGLGMVDGLLRLVPVVLWHQFRWCLLGMDCHSHHLRVPGRFLRIPEQGGQYPWEECFPYLLDA